MWIRTTNGIEFIPMTTTMQGLYVPKIKYYEKINFRDSADLYRTQQLCNQNQWCGENPALYEPK